MSHRFLYSRLTQIARAVVLLSTSAVLPATAVAQTQTATKPPSIGAALNHTAAQIGLWGAIGIGRGSAGLHCTTCTDESRKAYVVDGSIGVRVAPRLLLSADSYAWIDVFGGGIDRVSRGTHLTARVYPAARSSIFLAGGAGVASFRVTDGAAGFTTKSPSVLLGAGYEWRTANVVLSPTVSVVASTGGRLRSNITNNTINENARLMMLRTSIAFAWHKQQAKP